MSVLSPDNHKGLLWKVEVKGTFWEDELVSISDETDDINVDYKNDSMPVCALCEGIAIIVHVVLGTCEELTADLEGTSTGIAVQMVSET